LGFSHFQFLFPISLSLFPFLWVPNTPSFPGGFSFPPGQFQLQFLGGQFPPPQKFSRFIHFPIGGQGKGVGPKPLGQFQANFHTISLHTFIPSPIHLSPHFNTFFPSFRQHNPLFPFFKGPRWSEVGWAPKLSPLLYSFISFLFWLPLPLGRQLRFPPPGCFPFPIPFFSILGRHFLQAGLLTFFPHLVGAGQVGKPLLGG